MISHKHHLQLVSVRVIVDELGHTLVNNIVLDRHVHRDSSLQVYDVIFECLVFYFQITKSFQEIKACLICLKCPTFKIVDIVSGNI